MVLGMFRKLRNEPWYSITPAQARALLLRVFSEDELERLLAQYARERAVKPWNWIKWCLHKNTP